MHMEYLFTFLWFKEHFFLCTTKEGRGDFRGCCLLFFPFMTEVLILITMFFTSLGPGIARRWLSFNCANFGRRFKMYATKRRRRTVKTYVSISTFSIPCHILLILSNSDLTLASGNLRGLKVWYISYKLYTILRFCNFKKSLNFMLFCIWVYLTVDILMD